MDHYELSSEKPHAMMYPTHVVSQASQSNYQTMTNGLPVLSADQQPTVIPLSSMGSTRTRRLSTHFSAAPAVSTMWPTGYEAVANGLGGYDILVSQGMPVTCAQDPYNYAMSDSLAARSSLQQVTPTQPGLPIGAPQSVTPFDNRLTSQAFIDNLSAAGQISQFTNGAYTNTNGAYTNAAPGGSMSTVAVNPAPLAPPAGGWQQQQTVMIAGTPMSVTTGYTASTTPAAAAVAAAAAAGYNTTSTTPHPSVMPTAVAPPSAAPASAASWPLPNLQGAVPGAPMAALNATAAVPGHATAIPVINTSGTANGSGHYGIGSSRSQNKVKLLVSSGGSFARDNVTGQCVYLGGETRLVAVTQCPSLTGVMEEMSKSSSLTVDETCCIKYELPGFAEVLVDLVDDEDVLNMWEEWTEYCQVDKPTYKLRLYVEYPCYPLQALVEGSSSTSQSTAPDDSTEAADELSALPQPAGGSGGGGGASGLMRAGSCDTELSSEDINAITDTPRVNLLDLEAKLEIIAPSDLQVLRFLGAGAYGEVYLSKWHSNEVAVKCLSPSLFSGADFAKGGNEQVVEDLIKEASILGSLRHPNIVWLYGIVLPEAKVHALNFLKGRLEPGQAIDAVTVLSDFTNGSELPQMGYIRPPALVAEYMSAGSLRAAINRKAEFLRASPVKVKIALDAARGMEYLHTKRIVHFDLKSGNLLVGFRERHVVAKVADFGLSKQRQQTYVTGITSLRGTLPWTAPEIIKTPQAVNEKVDLYSFGVMLWELWTGREPFEGINYHALVHMMAMQEDVRPTLPGAPDWEGDAPDEPASGWSSLMQQCWHTDPASRPTFTQVVQQLEEMRKEGRGKMTAKERASSA